MSADKPLAMRLRAARETRGLTQAQAAAELGVSRPLLIAIERGTRDASPHQIATLAQAYQVPVSELLRPTPPPTIIARRLTAIVPAGQHDAEDLQAAIGLLQHQADSYIDLLRLSGAHPPRRPEPIRALSSPDPQRAEDLATEERNRLGLGDGPLPMLREVLELQGGLRIFLLALPLSVAGLFVTADVLGGCAGINSRHPCERRRWTMAHEYAHHLTNSDRAEITQVTHRRRPEAEQFADAFAASFLMPRSGLSRRYHELQGDHSEPVAAVNLAQLARLYGVSIRALSSRLEELDLLRHRPSESPLEDNFRLRVATEILDHAMFSEHLIELPVHFRMLAIQLFAEAAITEVQLARYLDTDIVGARRTYAEFTETADVALDGSRLIFDLAEAVG